MHERGQVRRGEQFAREPIPHEQRVVTAAGDEQLGPARRDAEAAHEISMAEAEGLDDVRLRGAARHADMLVAVGGDDVRPAGADGGRDGGEHGHVAEEEDVLELGGGAALGAPGLGFVLQARLVGEGAEIAPCVNG